MMPRLRPPRLLPITIFALAGLLAVKSSDLVRAATATTDTATQVSTTTLASAPASHPAPLPAAPVQPDPAKPSEDSAAAPVTDGERTVLLELRQRRQELDSREATVAARESLLAATEQKLVGRVVELQALQKKLEALEATRKEREDASWQGLVKLYEAMKPRDAATIFNDLEMPVLLQVVDRMKEAKAAPVLAAMQPDKARDLTAKIAQMRMRRDDPGGGTAGG
jgi:flagellar motility protein MotE (MotC chaperone)